MPCPPYKALYASLACLLFITSLQGQISDYEEAWRWAHFTMESGLPSNDVRQVYETTDGVFWAGTASGLVWFDGFQWNVVDSDPSLTSHTLLSIYGTFRDNILIGTGKRLYLVNKHHFRLLYNSPEVIAALPFDEKAILILKNSSLHLWRGDTLEPFGHGDSLTQKKVFTVLKSTAGNIWMNHSNGLYRWEKDRWQHILTHPMVTKFSIPYVVENVMGAGMAYTSGPYEQHGLWEWDADSPPRRNRSEKPDIVRAMDISASGDAIIVYQSGGARIRRNGDWTSLDLHRQGIKNVYSVRYSAAGDLWICAETGLHLYKNTPSRWTSWGHETPDLRNSVNEIIRARDGSIWIGTSDGLEIHKPDGSVRYITQLAGTQLSIVTGLTEDGDGNIWISSGSSFGGTFRWDGVSWKYFPITNDPDETRIHKIRLDRQGRLWFLDLGNPSIAPGNRQTRAFIYSEKSFTPFFIEEKRTSGKVYAFAEGSNNSLWFGTWTGISRWTPPENDLQSGKGSWTFWYQDPRDEKLLQRVLTLAIDSEERVWFGNLWDGVSYINRSDSVCHIGSRDGFFYREVQDIKIDPFGKLWASTKVGLACYDGENWMHYDDRSGLPFSSLWPVLPLEHEVYVGTQGKGVALLHRSDEATRDPRIVLSHPLTKEDEYLFHWRTFAYWGALSPRDIRSRYRIDNHDWSNWSIEREISYKDLEPGDHVFRVQAAGVFGQYDPYGAKLTFTVPPPLFLRPFFFVPTGMLIIGIMSLTGLLLWRKRSHDRALRASEAKFRAATENTSSAIFIYRDSEILFMNSGAKLLTGYDEVELNRMTFREVIHPDDHEVFMKLEESRREDSVTPKRAEFRIITKGAHVRWVDATIGWIRFQGTPVSLATAFDITDRKLAEEARRESDERYRIITELMSDYAYLDRFEPDGSMTVLWMTDSFTKVTGYSIDEAKDPSLLQRFVYPDDLPVAIENIRRVQRGERATMEGRIICKDGAVLWMRNYVAPIWNDDHTRVTHMYGIASNITQRKHDEEQLRRLATELSRTEEQERRRMATFLHDQISQSLLVSRMKLDALRTRSDLSKAFDQSIAEVQELLQRSIEHTRTLTFELCPPILYDLGLVPAVDWLAEQMRDAHKLTVQFTDDGKPKPLADEWRNTLYTGAREALINIVKHAEAKNVWIDLRCCDGNVHLAIEDDGVGFDPGHSRSIHSGQRNETGFGLSNLRERLSHLGGHLELESSQGKGTRVTMVAPTEGNSKSQ